MKSNLKLILYLIVVSLAAQGLSVALPPYFSQMFMLACINAVLAVSLNLVNGLSGQFSLGQAGFMAVGAYTAASVNVFFLGALRGMVMGDQCALGFSLPVVGGWAGRGRVRGVVWPH